MRREVDWVSWRANRIVIANPINFQGARPEHLRRSAMSLISLTFLGHSAIRVHYGIHDILVDPYLSGNPVAIASGIRADQFRPTHIVLTHAHGDHLGDTVEIARASQATVVATFELANHVADQGCRTIGMGIGGSSPMPFGRMKFTVAHHSSSTPDGRSMGNPAGVLLFLGGRTIYHAGDTALFGDMALIAARHPIDVALLPIGDRYTMGVDDAVEAVRLLRPRLTVPIHFNTYPAITADASRFVAEAAADGFEARVLAAGETLTLHVESAV